MKSKTKNVLGGISLGLVSVAALSGAVVLGRNLAPKKKSINVPNEVNYQYQTNNVNTIDDLVVGNIYKVDLSKFTLSNNGEELRVCYISFAGYSTKSTTSNINYEYFYENMIFGARYQYYLQKGFWFTVNGNEDFGNYNQLQYVVYEGMYDINNYIQGLFSASDYLGHVVME